MSATLTMPILKYTKLSSALAFSSESTTELEATGADIYFLLKVTKFFEILAEEALAQC